MKMSENDLTINFIKLGRGGVLGQGKGIGKIVKLDVSGYWVW